MKFENFNDGWMLKKGSANPLMEMFQPSKNPLIPVDLPCDAMILETPEKDTKNGGQTGYFPGKSYHYIKRFTPLPQWEGGHTLLEFEGAYMQAKVFINGDYAGGHPHGYSNFYICLDDFLKFGQENEIDVQINNSAELNSRWYSGSGLYRNVNLYTAGTVYIKEDGVRVTTPEIDAELAVAAVDIELANAGTYAKQINIVTSIFDPNGIEVASGFESVHLFLGSELTHHQRLYIKNPSLWDCENPALYSYVVKLCENTDNTANVLDEVCTSFGVRSLSMDPVRGFRLNGQITKLRGACIHHDNGVIGANTYYDAEERRCLQLKAAGFNSIRMSHHPMSKAMLTACDRHGMLVMDELSDMWTRPKNTNDYSLFFPDYWEKDVELMVAKDYNHPCVILYSIGNEIPEVGTPKGAELNRKIAAKFKALDPARYTTNALNGMLAAMEDMGKMMSDITGMTGEEMAAKMTAPAESENQGESKGSDELNGMMSFMVGPLADAMARHPLMSARLAESAAALDVVGFNYMTGRHVSDHDEYPNRIVLGSETFPSDIVRLWDIVKKNPHVIGDMTWTGYDYLGEAGIGIFRYDKKQGFSSEFPDRAAYCGDIDIIGNRRIVSYLREIVYGLRREPYISVERLNHNGQTPSKSAWMYKDAISSWTWPGFEGEMASVEVFSDAPEVELFLNGVSMGKKAAGESAGYIAAFSVSYAPGTLTAKAIRDGAFCEEYVLQTSSDASALAVVTDKDTIKVGGQDLAYVMITLADSQGVPNLYAQKKVTVTATGAGSMIGLGSADPLGGGSYQDSAWDTYDGSLLAVIRSGKETGDIKICVSAPDCGTVERVIHVI